MIIGRVGLISKYPANIPGTVLQLDAATLSASPVSSWSYEANPLGGTTVATGNFTQGTGSKQPVWTASSANMNGLPSVIYDGTKVMSAPSTAALQLIGDMTMATVIMSTDLTNFNTVGCSKGPSSEFDMFVAATNQGRFVRQGIANFFIPIVSTGVTYSMIFTSNSSVATFYLNGVVVKFFSSVNFPTVSTTANAVFIGQRSDAVTKLIGEQPELLLINRCLAPIEIATLHQFWATKYNLPV